MVNLTTEDLPIVLRINSHLTLVTTPYGTRLGSIPVLPENILVEIEGYDEPVFLHDMILNWQVTDGTQR